MHYVCLLTILALIHSISAIRCSDITVRYGRVKYRSRGRVAIFGCWAGFTLYGEKYAGCFRGAWDVNPPKCVRKGCSDLSFRFGTIKKPLYNSAVLGFRCYPGYDLVGPKEVYCNGTSYDNLPPVCKREETDIGCDFENQRLCKWRNDPKANLTFNLRQGAVPSRILNTGPDHDHTLDPELDGYYLYLETSSTVPGEVARIFSPYLPHANDDNTCFKFWYHMFGSTVGSLRVFINETKVFEKQGNRGDKWRLGKVKLPSTSHFKIVIEAVTGKGYVGDIAIDDLDMGECTDDSGSTCSDRCGEDESDEFSQCDCHPACKYDDSCCPDYSHFCIAETTTAIAESPTTNEESSSDISNDSTTINSDDQTDKLETITENGFTSDSDRITFDDAFTASDEFEVTTSVTETTEINEINTDIDTVSSEFSNYVTNLPGVDKTAFRAISNETETKDLITNKLTTLSSTPRYNLRPRTLLTIVPTKMTTLLTTLTKKLTTVTPKMTTIKKITTMTPKLITTTKSKSTSLPTVKTTKTTTRPSTTKPTTIKATTVLPLTNTPISTKDPKITTLTNSTQTINEIHTLPASNYPYTEFTKLPIDIRTTESEFIVTESKVERVKWKSKYKPKDMFQSVVIVPSENSVNIAGICALTIFLMGALVSAALAVYILRKRRLSSRSSDGAEILFIPTDEVLDFTHATSSHRKRDSGVYSETVMSLKRDKR